MIIRRVGPLSCAKIVGALYAALGLIIGAVVSLIAAVGGFASDSNDFAFAAAFGVGAIVFFPLLYGGLGFLSTLIVTWLYNMTAAVVGGIELDVA